MTLHYLGTQTVGQCIPTALVAQGQAIASLEGDVASLQSLIDSLTSAQAQLSLNPPSLVSSLASAQAMVTGLQAALLLGVPAVSATPLALLAQQILDLLSQLADATVQLDAARALGATLGTAGVSAYGFTGQVGSMGNELTSELISGTPGGQSTDEAGGVVLVATTPAARAALGVAFGIDL